MAHFRRSETNKDLIYAITTISLAIFPTIHIRYEWFICRQWSIVAKGERKLIRTYSNLAHFNAKRSAVDQTTTRLQKEAISNFEQSRITFLLRILKDVLFSSFSRHLFRGPCIFFGLERIAPRNFRAERGGYRLLWRQTKNTPKKSVGRVKRSPIEIGFREKFGYFIG